MRVSWKPISILKIFLFSFSDIERGREKETASDIERGREKETASDIE